MCHVGEAEWFNQSAIFSTQFSKRRSIPYELSRCVLLFHRRCLRISPFDPEDVAKSIHPAVKDPVFHIILGRFIQLDQDRQKFDLFEGFRTLFLPLSQYVINVGLPTVPWLINRTLPSGLCRPFPARSRSKRFRFYFCLRKGIRSCLAKLQSARSQFQSA